MKNLFYKLPKFLKQFIVGLIESTGYFYVKNKNSKFITNKHPKGEKNNVLIYHINALSFGGTEKNLQMIAKHLDKNKYNVFFMHGTKTEKNRLDYLKDSGVNIIHFEYEKVQNGWPYLIGEMNPRLETVINEHAIDCIFTATPGQTIYPIINIRNIPIVLINIFGSFTLQGNIKKSICISEEVKKLAARVVDEDHLAVEYIPSERPLLNPEKSKALRERFNIPETDLLFGRIGRADDSIFDPIALLAFEVAVKTNPNIHYVIMSPANLAKELVEKNNVPNVHWLEPSYLEEDVWAFHGAIDVLAHFRMDGESFGLNIAESMLVGNPILTHKSHIWNAHLEYLDSSFSLYAEKGDYLTYAKNMNAFIEHHKTGELKKMGQRAKEKAERLFLIENSITRYQKIINEAIQ